MIVPMKKVSLIIRGSEKDKALKKLRSLGILHIEITEGTGGRLANLKEQVALLESAIFTIGKIKNTEQKNVNAADALTIATEVNSLDEEKKRCQAENLVESFTLLTYKNLVRFKKSNILRKRWN